MRLPPFTSLLQQAWVGQAGEGLPGAGSFPDWSRSTWPPGNLIQHLCFPSPPGPDLDECRVRSLCQHACQNTEGSYYCLCPSGYRLLPSGKNCQGELARASPHPSRSCAVCPWAIFLSSLNLTLLMAGTRQEEGGTMASKVSPSGGTPSRRHRAWGWQSSLFTLALS